MVKYNRTHMCGELTIENIGQDASIIGWAQRIRDLGGLLFIDLRDRTGITQVVFNKDEDPELFEKAQRVRGEYVIQVIGKVAARSEKAINPKIKTGYIELLANEILIISKAETPPIYIDDNLNVSENLRLKYRYLDLRRPIMQNIFFVRHRVNKIIRDYFDRNGFIEIETPVLTKTTPEGARDYLVPSRVQPGKFFALPQSPQLFKQILMVSGFDKYYQIVKCFRDEDLRADRQPEFTQLDMEMSFVEAEDVIGVIEGLMKDIFKKIKDVDIEHPLPRMTYKEAMNRYGSDKPDIRFGMELKDLSDLLSQCEFKVFSETIKNGGKVKAINAASCGASLSRKDIDGLSEFVKTYKAKGLAWINYTSEGIKSPILKFIKEEEIKSITERMGAKIGDIIFIVADNEKVVHDSLG